MNGSISQSSSELDNEYFNEGFLSSPHLVIETDEHFNSIEITHMEKKTNDLQVKSKDFSEEENHDYYYEDLTSYFFISTVVFLIQKSLRELYIN
jgi:hypothetical protein